MKFEKELSNSNIGAAGMHDRYITIPKTQVDPEEFFGVPPDQIAVKDDCMQLEYVLPYKKEANGEYRLTRIGDYFDLMKANVGDRIVFEKHASGNIKIQLKRKNTNVINDFKYDLCSSGLKFESDLITRFIASLLTKPFVIFTGLSGSGKTKLAQAFVQWISQDKSQYRIIPVGADWTNREPLLGYPNALKIKEYVKPDSGVLDLIIQANQKPELPHFLILDEMNLSHVERYFADFLSVMESKEEIQLYSEGTVENGVPARLKVPSNLYIIGTVNIDETTNMFSPKVLDRANTIEFRVTHDEIKYFLDNIKEVNMDFLIGQGAGMAKRFLEMAANKDFATNADINAVLIQFFGELKKIGAEFGYRSATEILRLIYQLTVLDGNLTKEQKIDIAIMQKLLPKLHGSRRKLSPVLETLGSFCISRELKIVKDVFEKADYDFKSASVYYPLSLEKISRMYRGAIDNGFASFAEA
jgi:5-methylcytosine-specific restriction protein B